MSSGLVVGRIGCPRSTSHADMSVTEKGRHAPNHKRSARHFVSEGPRRCEQRTLSSPCQRELQVYAGHAKAKGQGSSDREGLARNLLASSSSPPPNGSIESGPYFARPASSVVARTDSAV